MSDNVVNISDRVLTQAEVSLLSRGLKFYPTPVEVDISAVKRDIKEFGRKVKCKAYFHFNNVVEQDGQKFRQFREKSSWYPTEVNPTIEVYLRKLEERVLAINERGSNFSNLLKNEQEALKNLKKYHDIVIIKEADKGGAVVAWGRKDYCKEAYNHLNDQQVYAVTESDPLNEVNVFVEKALDPLMDKGYINAANKKYLVVSKSRLGKFYLLPKIHKGLENVPGRPVISNCGFSLYCDFVYYRCDRLVSSYSTRGGVRSVAEGIW